MAHYAFLDESNKVTHVIVGADEYAPTADGRTWEQVYAGIVGQACKRTSYNTRAGVHYNDENEPDGGEAFRMNYASIGFTYDQSRDAFIPPKPYESWLLDETTCTWVAPFPEPDHGGPWYWDEADQSWTASEDEQR